MTTFLHEQTEHDATLLRIDSDDGTNRLTRHFVLQFTEIMRRLAIHARPLVIAGNRKFFSAGADLHEIAALNGTTAYQFAQIGQTLMKHIDQFPAPVYAAVEGYCMGGGFDLALACHHRVASPHAIFAHRGAALGLITGWGGTQRLPRIIGKGRALRMFVAAEKITALEACRIALVDAVVDDPVAEALRRIQCRPALGTSSKSRASSAADISWIHS